MSMFLNVMGKRINITEINYFIPRQMVSKKDKNVKEYVLNVYFKNNDILTLSFKEESQRDHILGCFDGELGVKNI